MIIKLNGVEIRANGNEVKMVYGSYKEEIKHNKDGEPYKVYVADGKEVYPGSLKIAIIKAKRYITINSFDEEEIVSLKQFLEREKEINRDIEELLGVF